MKVSTRKPPEVCHEHDVPIDEYGCWACGHAGPLSDAVYPSYYRWSMDYVAEYRAWLAQACADMQRIAASGENLSEELDAW